LRAKIDSGWIATRIQDGARASAHHLAAWNFASVATWADWGLSTDDFVGEIADEIESLNGRPTSTQRCRMSIDRFLAEPSEANRAALRADYYRIPTHLRRYTLGDMDAKDAPLRVLMTSEGSSLPEPDGRTVTA